MQADRIQVTDKLVDALYTEAMLLADEARGYFDAVGQDDRAAMLPLDRVTFSCESLKVTTRLMHVIAWLLARRAHSAHSGPALAPLSAATPTDSRDIAGLPIGAKSVILASVDLYQRIARLEERLSAPVVASPVAGLQNRLSRAF